MRWLVLIIFVVTSCSWNRTDKAIFVTGMSLKAVDYIQTREIARNPNYYELNPIIGKYPSKEKVTVYFALGGLMYYLVANWLPERWRTPWLSFWATASFTCVVHNHRIGIRIGS